MEFFMATILPGIISGKYTLWFFNVVVVQFGMTVVNNFALLWMIGTYWQKWAASTDSKWDDKWSARFVNWLSKKKPGAKIDKEGK